MALIPRFSISEPDTIRAMKLNALDERVSVVEAGGTGSTLTIDGGDASSSGASSMIIDGGSA